MRFAGQALSHSEWSPQEAGAFEDYSKPGNIQVNPASSGLELLRPTLGDGTIVPAFEHPMMDPMRGPSYRDRYLFRHLTDPQSPIPLT